MDSNLDKTFRQWLESLSLKWGTSTDLVVNSIASDEICNRHETYPELAEVLSQSPVNRKEFADVALECWALGGRFDIIRLNEFIRSGEGAFSAIEELIHDFPEDNPNTAKRIDTFVERAVKIAYSKSRGSADYAGAALLCSVILSSLYPDRFVDFRFSRWDKFARSFGYKSLPSKKSRYGDMIICASQFATDLSKTETYQKFWPEENALWTIAGISWVFPSPKKPEIEPVDPDEIESFPEGAEKRRLHITRERNPLLVQMVKDQRYKIDPLLRCEVCGFSFIEHYGKRGEKFIEAHHKKPVASLKPGNRTRIEDIALICSNCHRMIHKGDKSLSVEELRRLIRFSSTHSF